ncbi:hypothetical protein [Actinopolyspora erythraea]|uniref:hypothetical protein n=1 Tax=Actinopolyspora erythraea TaxID=414996 RepID=UPI000A8052C5|nr:hypothetical protein [Actinopolyspora erythraea]
MKVKTNEPKRREDRSAPFCVATGVLFVVCVALVATITELNLDYGASGATWSPVLNTALVAGWVFDLLFLIAYLNAGEISGNSDNILANLAKPRAR